MLDENLKVITTKKVVIYSLLQSYETMFLMLSNFEFEESSNFCSRFFSSWNHLEDIHRATIILTKARIAGKVKLSLRYLNLWTEDKDLRDAKSKKGVLTVVDLD